MPVTNYEKIKQMSIQELAEFLGQKPYCTLNEVDCIYGWHGNDCAKHAKEWLESRSDDKS